ncbi:hypothetical protein IKO50_07010, partial [bacterium]|nr:hypothetical protein [bacterium]
NILFSIVYPYNVSLEKFREVFATVSKLDYNPSKNSLIFYQDDLSTEMNNYVLKFQFTPNSTSHVIFNRDVEE